MPLQHLLDWSGGLQPRTSRFLRKPNQWKLLVNAHTDESGSVTKRRGFRKVGGTIQSGKSVLGINTAGQYLYASSNNSGDTATVLKYNNSATAPVGGTWTTVSGGTALPALVYPVFVPFAEIKALVVCGGIAAPTSGSDFMTTLTATYAAPQTTANVSNAPKSLYAVRWRDRIYHGYCAENTGWTTAHWYNETVAVKPNRVVYSNVPSAGALTYEDQGVSGYANFFDVDADITGLGVNSDQLLTFTASGFWTRAGDTTLVNKKRYSIGCDSHWTIKNVDIYTFWFNQNGVYAYAGGKPEKISTPIQPIIDAIVDPTACFAEAPDDDHYRLYVGTLTLEGKSFRNCVIQYTLSTNAWAVYSYSVPTTPSTSTFTAFGSFNNGTVTRMYAGSSVGQAYVFSEPADTSSAKVHTDGDQSSETYPIAMLARTTELSFDSPQEKKDVGPLVVYSETAQGASVRVRTDPTSSDGQFKEAGQVHSTVELFPVPVNPGYWHQIEITESSSNQETKINGFSIQVNQDTKNLR